LLPSGKFARFSLAIACLLTGLPVLVAARANARAHSQLVSEILPLDRISQAILGLVGGGVTSCLQFLCGGRGALAVCFEDDYRSAV